MMSYPELSLLLFIGIVAAIAGGVFLLVKKLATPREPALDENGQPIDEARLIQEMHHSLIRLEERVDNLESLLLERTTSRHDHATEKL